MKRNNKKLIFLVLIILALMSFLFSCKKRRIDVTKFTSVEELVRGIIMEKLDEPVYKNQVELILDDQLLQAMNKKKMNKF